MGTYKVFKKYSHRLNNLFPLGIFPAHITSSYKWNLNWSGMIPCCLTHSMVIITIFWVFDWMIPDWQGKKFGWISSKRCPLPFPFITDILSRSSLVLFHQYYQQNIIFPFGYILLSRISKQSDENNRYTINTWYYYIGLLWLPTILSIHFMEIRILPVGIRSLRRCQQI